MAAESAFRTVFIWKRVSFGCLPSILETTPVMCGAAKLLSVAVYQQNLTRFDLAVVVLEAKSNSYEDLASLMDRTNAVLGDVVPGEATRIRA
jgi:hypothetical protein